MRRLTAITAFLLLGAALVCRASDPRTGSDPASSSGLRAGVAQATITPELAPGHTVYLAGFGHNRIATGIHDDLTARCLALSTGNKSTVLCSVDLIGLFYEDVLAIRRQFEQMLPGAPPLIVAATHTHAGPDTLGLYGPKPLTSGVDPEYLKWVEHRLAATAAEAVRHMQPATLELGRDDHPLLALLQGVDRPPIVKDPYLFAMRFVARSNSHTIATVVNWSDHPEVLNRQNTEITADYPHWVRSYLEKDFGGTALFFSAAIGKVSPLTQVSLVDPETGRVAEDGTWRKAELLGDEIGQLAERALQRGEKADIDAILFRSATLDVPLENVLFRAAIAAGVFGDRRPLYTEGKHDPATAMQDVPGLGRVQVATGRDIRTEVDVLELRSAGKIKAEVVTVPGEIFPELVNGGLERYTGADFPDAPFEPVLRPRFRSKYQFILGLGNDEIGYLIPKAEWDAEPPWLKNADTPWYGEINSAGPDAAGAILNGLTKLTAR